MVLIMEAHQSCPMVAKAPFSLRVMGASAKLKAGAIKAPPAVPSADLPVGQACAGKHLLPHFNFFLDFLELKVLGREVRLHQPNDLELVALVLLNEPFRLGPP